MRAAEIIALGWALLPLTGVAAQAGDAPACPLGAAAALPPELVGWKAPGPASAAARKSGLRAAVLGPGIAVDAALRPTAEVRYLVPPEKPGSPQSYGGLFQFAIERAGSYRIALGGAAWIDVVAGRKTVSASGHGHGPDCTGVRKMVEFTLAPGIYALQISGSADPTLRLMVARLR